MDLQTAAPNRIRSIAYPTNFSHASGWGLTWSIHLAHEYQAELLLLHVVPPLTPIFETESLIRAEAEIALSVLLAQLQTANINARGFLLTGTTSIGDQIVRAARLERVDLIIMGSRARTGIARFFSGSMVSRVLTRAHCPVLVVPLQRRRQLSVRGFGEKSKHVC